MTNLNNKKLSSRVVSIITLIAVFFAISVSGALWGFWRAIYNNPFTALNSWNENFEYGYWYGNLWWGYGYGYWYGAVMTDSNASNAGYYYSTPTTGDGAYENPTVLTNLSNLTSVSTIDWGNPSSTTKVTITTTTQINPTGSVKVTLPSGVEITDSNGANFDATQLAADTLSNLSTTLASTETKKWAIKFWIPGIKLFFNKPVKIEVPVPWVVDGTISIKVKHATDSAYSTAALTNSASATCNNWIPNSNASATATVSSEVATIYTCAASEFVAYTSSSGWSSWGWGWWTYTPTCTWEHLECKSYLDSYVWFRKDGVSCTWWDLGKVCNISDVIEEELNNENEEETDNTNIIIDDIIEQEKIEINIDDVTGEITITKQDWSSISFKDITTEYKDFAWYIAVLASMWVISGYDDWTFRPGNNASRTEFLHMTLKALWYEYTGTDSSWLTFNDKNTFVDWQAKAIAKAAEMWIITTTNPNFRPNDNISRAEALKILLGAAWIQIINTQSTDFTDVTIDWQIPYVETAKNMRVISGQIINWKLVFRPNDSISRAEVSKIVVETMSKKIKE